MHSKRDIRALKRENTRLKVENSTLIAKNRKLNYDNGYLSSFLNLIIDLAHENMNESPRRLVKIFH